MYFFFLSASYTIIHKNACCFLYISLKPLKFILGSFISEGCYIPKHMCAYRQTHTHNFPAFAFPSFSGREKALFTDFFILLWQHVGDNFWQHCDNWGEWEKHTKLDKPVHPCDLEVRAGQPSAAGRRCPILGCWLSSQQCESLHTHRPFSIHVYHPASPSSSFSPWKYLSDRHVWEGR